MTSFRITGLPPAPFAALFGLDDAALRDAGARRYVVDAQPGFPDRIELRELEIGERAILVNFVHLDVNSPYRSSHAVFVREGASKPFDRIGEVPEVMRRRLLSVRGLDDAGMMVDADVVEGTALEPLIDRLFADPRVAYLHAHYAKRGCYAARIDRAQ